jgi:hypothetical protein
MPLRHPHFILRLILVVNRDVQISPVAVIGSATQATGNLLASLDRQHVAEIEDGLLPVGVLCVWACGKSYRLVASRKLNVEPCDEGVDEVVAAHGKVERELECEIIGCASVEVECDDGGGISDNGFELDSVDKWFGECGHLQRRVVEAVDVIPDCDSH